MSTDALANPLEDILILNLARARLRLCDDIMQRLGGVNLTPTCGMVLVLIGANPGTTQSQLAKTLWMKRPNMQAIVRELERRDLVRREAVDGRSQALSLTPLGRETCDVTYAAFCDQDAHFAPALREAGQTQDAVVAAARSIFAR